MIYVESWNETRSRIAAGLDPAEAGCVDWPTLEAAYRLATHQLTIPAPAGWERFSYGGLPMREGCRLPDVTTRGTPWLFLAGLAGLLVLGTVAAGRARGASSWT